MDNPSSRLPNLVLVCGVCLLAGLGPAWGQEATTDPVAALRAELHAGRGLYSPDGPIRLRFTLINTSEQPVTIPLEYPVSAADGLALPAQLALGSGSQQPLSVIREDEAPKAVSPPAASLASEPVEAIRLAPHGTLGTELDLRDYYPKVRYPGVYRVEWRPFDGRLGVAAADFRVEIRKDAILVTDCGKITFVLQYDQAPQNVENFLELVRQGFYNGKTFHRVIPGFVVQGGCPKGDGTGTRPDGKLVPAEFHDTPVDVGTLLMALKPGEPNSASCQFFVALARLPELDGQYTTIGQASDEESLRTLQKLAEVPTDLRNRPLSPLVIRSINLVDTEQTRIRHLEARHQPQSAPAVREGQAAAGSAERQ
jgi:peptidyl-prolyl cis-trans isomerase B (cyclophilin B)